MGMLNLCTWLDMSKYMIKAFECFLPAHRKLQRGVGIALVTQFVSTTFIHSEPLSTEPPVCRRAHLAMTKRCPGQQLNHGSSFSINNIRLSHIHAHTHIVCGVLCTSQPTCCHFFFYLIVVSSISDVYKLIFKNSFILTLMKHNIPHPAAYLAGR